MAIVTEPNITAPTEPHIYEGKQVIINGNRLLFNAKDDDILLYSNTYLGFSTNGSIHFDTGDTEKDCFFVINTPDIYLGLNGEAYPTEPGVLGDALETVLNDLIDYLYSDLIIFLRSEYRQRIPGGSTLGVSSSVKFNNLRKKLDIIRKTLKDFKSNTVKLT